MLLDRVRPPDDTIVEELKCPLAAVALALFQLSLIHWVGQRAEAARELGQGRIGSELALLPAYALPGGGNARHAATVDGAHVARREAAKHAPIHLGCPAGRCALALVLALAIHDVFELLQACQELRAEGVRGTVRAAGEVRRSVVRRVSCE